MLPKNCLNCAFKAARLKCEINTSNLYFYTETTLLNEDKILCREIEKDGNLIELHGNEFKSGKLSYSMIYYAGKRRVGKYL